MAYDVRRVRAAFPALTDDADEAAGLRGAAFFDGPGGSQVPRAVAHAVASTLGSAISNRGQVTASARRADVVVVEARKAMADLLGTDPDGIVFGRSMTALTFDFARTLVGGWGPGDEVVVSRLDHDANIRPWLLAAERAGVSIRWVDFDPDTGVLDPADVRAVVSERTRLVAVTAASNLIGTRPAVAEISAIAHAVGALTYVDGVHATAHVLPDMDALGADFFVCSPYKFLGPHIGVLGSRRDLLESLMPDKLLPSSMAVPDRFELGTLPYELLAGVTAAVDFMAELDDAATGDRRKRLTASYEALDAHERVLRDRIEQGLAQIGATCYSRAADRTPTLLFELAGHESAQVQHVLAARGVNAPAGSFYALEASRHLGLGDAGAVRVGLAPYSDDDDVERLLGALGQIANG